MSEAGIGRVLVASLHQAISDELPTRLGFYETWLDAEGLREGTIGLAPLFAVLSFLRQEGDVYDRIAARAGAYAAEWTVESMAPFERSILASAPAWLRVRLLLRKAGQLVRTSYDGSRAVARVRKNAARVIVDHSIFCSVREPVSRPLCGFYAAASMRLLSLFGIDAVVNVVRCCGTAAGPGTCELSITATGDRFGANEEAPAA